MASRVAYESQGVVVWQGSHTSATFRGDFGVRRLVRVCRRNVLPGWGCHGAAPGTIAGRCTAVQSVT